MGISPESFGDFRRGDEPEDARLGDFKVFCGTPSERARLQNNDPGLLTDLDAELQELLESHEMETKPDTE